LLKNSLNKFCHTGLKKDSINATVVVNMVEK
jgi:hypothetical protein